MTTKQGKKLFKAVQEFLDLPLASRGREWDGIGAERRVREWAGGPEKENVDFEQYQRAFLWWDEENPENFTSYKLGYADVIGGELQAVPRGIFAVAAVLEGARGGVEDIPENEREQIREVVAAHYEKMRRVFEDESIVPPWEVEQSVDKVKKEYYADFIHKEEERQLVFGIVMEPNSIDAHGDFVTEKDIETAAHNFMLKSQVVGKGHTAKAKAKVVESFIAPEQMSIGGQDIKKGSWIMVTKVFDKDLWNAVKTGDFTGYSIGGFGHRTDITT